MKTCIILAGPTAVGKTGLAIKLAQHFSTSIISADSRQCYKELNIGVARPSAVELATVPHYFIASHSITDEVNAKTFESYTLYSLERIFQEKDIAIITGGTGLYISALVNGLDHIPETMPEIRTMVRNGYTSQGMEWLLEQLKINDPEFVAKGEIKNPARVMRALEVVLSTGESITRFQSGSTANRPFQIINLALKLDKEQLHRNIETRVDQMIECGLEDEVKGLQHFRHLKALHTVGYTEIFNLLDGITGREDAIAAIKQNTRKYAKRQMTWFIRQPDTTWFDASLGVKPLLEYLTSVNLIGQS